MTLFVILVLGLLAVMFAREADKYKRQADFWERAFWERAYMDRAAKLEALVDLSQDYVDSELVSVRKAGG